VNGRRCRLPVTDEATGLCFRHFELRNGYGVPPDPEVVADELLGSIEDFSSADSINLFLGNLVKQLARKRIARPDAIALAYIGQLLLNSLPAMEKQFDRERYSTPKAARELEIFSALRRNYTPQDGGSSLPADSAAQVSNAR
jgi:hypothetical protein